MSYSISRYMGDISSPLVRLYVEFQVTYSEAPFPETLYDDPVYGTKFGYTDPDKFYEPLTLGNAVETVVELGEYRYGAYNDPDESSDWTNGSPDGDWMGMDYYKTEISAVYTFPTEAYLEWLDRDWLVQHPSINRPATFWQTYYITGGELSRLSSPEPFNLFYGTNPEMRKAEAQLYLDDAEAGFGMSSLLYELPGGYRTVELDTSDDDLAEYEIPYLEQTIAGAALMLTEMWLSDRGHSGLAELAGTISALDALETSIEERFVGPRLELIGLMASEDGELADYATIAEWEAANGLQAATLAGFIADNAAPAGLALASVSLIASEGASGDVLSVFGGGAVPSGGTDGSDRAIFGEEGAAYSGGAGRDYLAGGGGDDSLQGGANGDWLLGGGGSDTLKGGIGGDQIRGGTGADLLRGGRGGDRLDGGSGADRVEGAAGDDKLWGGNGWDKLTGGIGDDTLYGEAGDDRLKGDDGTDVLWGGNGRDLLEGGSDGDRLYGGAKSDQLYGNAGADRLWGGRGNDRLDGGLGNDTMAGEGGADSFVFNLAVNAGSRDVIADFDPGADRLLFAGTGRSAAAMLARAAQEGSDVHFAFGNGAELVLRDVELAALEARIDMI